MVCPSGASITEIPTNIHRSNYFSSELKTCEFEIGTASTAVDRELEKRLRNILSEESCNLVFIVQLEESYNSKEKLNCESLSIKLDCDVFIRESLN